MDKQTSDQVSNWHLFWQSECSYKIFHIKLCHIQWLSFRIQNYI